MGAKVDEPRKVVLTMRLTQKEHIQLLGEVDRAGYHSISRYIRERVIDGKRVFRSGSPLTGSEVRDRLNSIGTEIEKYGSDYNHIAKELTEIVDSRDGRMNPRTASVYLSKLVNLSHAIKKGMDDVLSLFHQVDQKFISPKGETIVIIKETRKMLQKIEIIGNLASDAELKSSNDGKQFIVFRVGVHENIGDERRSTFYDVTYPNGGILNYLKKGRQVYVSGKLSIGLNTWDGKTYLKARISARDIELCGNHEA